MAGSGRSMNENRIDKFLGLEGSCWTLVQRKDESLITSQRQLNRVVARLNERGSGRIPSWEAYFN